jgi:uncharacterized protein
MALPTHEMLVLMGGVIFLAYISFGITGAGASIISVPILSQFLPLTFIVPICLLLDFSASLGIGTTFRQHVDQKELKLLIPFAIVGTVVGITLLVHLPRTAALMVLGASILAYGIYSLRRHEQTKRVAQWWSFPAGLISGIMGALYGTGGPPYMMYLAGRIQDKAIFRATVSRMVTFGVGMRLIGFIVSGLLLRKELLITALLLLPLMFAGLWVGNKAHGKFSRQAVIRLISVLLIVSGTSLLLRLLLAHL